MSAVAVGRENTMGGLVKQSFVVALLLVLVVGCTGAPVATSGSAVGAPGGSTGGSTGGSASPGSASAPAYPFTEDAFPTLDGSTANIPLGSLVLQRLVGMPKEQADNLSFSTTPDAYRNLACYDPDPLGTVVLAYEPAQTTKDDIADCAKLEYHTIGRDALVFLANEKNPVKSLTTKQYKDIYTGKIKDWSAVGGAEAKIVAYERPEPSGSQALMRKFVIGTAKMVDTPTEQVPGDMGGLVIGVASYSNTGNALGYSVFYYAKEMFTKPGVKLLGADGVQPSSATIAAGTYPYVNPFYAVIRADEAPDSAARQVVAWLESPAGQKTVVDAGYVGKG